MTKWRGGNLLEIGTHGHLVASKEPERGRAAVLSAEGCAEQGGGEGRRAEGKAKGEIRRCRPRPPDQQESKEGGDNVSQKLNGSMTRNKSCNCCYLFVSEASQHQDALKKKNATASFLNDPQRKKLDARKLMW